MWGLGLSTGFLIGRVIFDMIFAFLPFRMSFENGVMISNVVGGFINGCIAAGIGGWVTTRILERNAHIYHSIVPE